MSDLDDALNSSTPIYAPADLFVNWAELPPGYAPEVDVLSNLGPQIGDQGFTIEQSLDDGFPGPVTMTGQNDASGKLDTDLVGRDAIIADDWGWCTDPQSGTGTGTTIFAESPADSTYENYDIIAIAVNSNTAVLTVDAEVVSDPNRWVLLGTQDDGATLKVWVWGRKYGGTPELAVNSNVSVSYSWVGISTWARTRNRMSVSYSVASIGGAGESVSQTTHTTPAGTLTRRGWVVNLYAALTAAGGWNAGTGTVEINEAAGTTTLMASRSTNLQDPGTYQYAGTTAVATAVAVMMTLCVEMVDTDRMDASTFFSPFNKDSPVYGFDRDTATVAFDFNVSTESGIQGTPMFTGLMEDIPVKGRSAGMSAVSETRIKLAASAQLPAVWAFNQACNTDWLATWLMARGGQFVGPPPSPFARFWAPMYGSIHPHLEGLNTYANRFYYAAATGVTAQIKGYPDVVPGPFGTWAMYGAQNDAELHRINVQMNMATELLPYQIEQGGGVFDQMSQENTAGRIGVWLRGDPVVAAPAWLGGDPIANDIFSYRMSMKDKSGALIADIVCWISSSDRKLRINIGGVGTGYSTVTSSATPLPTDGAWHFVGWSWDRDAGITRMKMDGSGGVFTGVTTPPQGLPVTDADWVTAGGTLTNRVYCHVPMSDFQVEAGGSSNDGFWTPYWPAPEGNATFRSWAYPMHAIVEPAPVEIWSTLAQLAQDTITAYRCDEIDNFAWMPLAFFGQPENMMPEEIVDTNVNAAEIDVRVDASKIRNVVTVQFPETRVDSVRTGIYSSMTSMVLPVGKTTLVIALDKLAAAVHGEGVPSTWNLTLLTATQISTKAFPQEHYITVNTKEDGSGTVITNPADLTARIISVEPGSVNMEFINRRRTTLYMTNNGDQVPYLYLMGYGVTASDGYVTARNLDPLLTRRERALSAELKWIQNRVEATQIANLLLSILSVPRAESQVVVIGDPRRQPGQLVTIKDAENTKAAGNWRILSITSKMQGAQFVQELKLVAVGPVAVWDDPDTTWDYAVWGE